MRRGTLIFLLGVYACTALLGEELVIGPRPQRPPLSAEALNTFKTRLADRDPARVEKAADELARSGDAAALPLLAQLYDSGDAARRAVAIRAIAQLGAGAQDETLLRIAVGDPFIALRSSAALALGRSPRAAQNIEQLAKLIDGPPGPRPVAPLFQFRAVQALAAIGAHPENAAASAKLAVWLKHATPEIATAAADGLGSIGGTAHAPLLVELLAQNDPELKPALSDALERISGERFRYDLVRWHEWLKSGALKKPEPSPGSNTPTYMYDGVELPPQLYTDIVIVFDTTGSMTKIWPSLSNAIDGVLAQMIRQSGSLRMGLVLYRADAPELSMNYTIKPLPLTRDHARIRAQMDDATFGGGSGGVHLGLDFALKAMPWRRHARKIVILIGDTSPLPAGVQSCARSIREAWEMDRILTTTLYVRTLHGDEHRQTYRLLSSAGAGRFFEFSRAEGHLVELSAETVDVKQTERAEETARKWFLPRDRK